MEEDKKKHRAAHLAIELQKYDALMAASWEIVAEMQWLMERAYALHSKNIENLKKLRST
jgi:hypothetical protein